MCQVGCIIRILQKVAARHAADADHAGESIGVREGHIELGGRLPVNTHGGQLSEAYIHGMNGVNEGVRLIRGTSVNQPEKCDHALVTAGVGVPSSAMILGKI